MKKVIYDGNTVYVMPHKLFDMEIDISIVHVIMLNDSVELAVVGTIKMAELIRDKLERKDFLKRRELFESFEDYTRQCFWHIHSVPGTNYPAGIKTFWQEFPENKIEIELKKRGYNDLGWMNGWRHVYYDDEGHWSYTPDEHHTRFGYAPKDHPEYRSCDGLYKEEIRYSTRGSKNLVICDDKKLYWWYDCSD